MENLIGLTLELAKKKLKNKNYRIVRIDGVGMIVTCDFRPERVNLEIENNIVVRVYGG
jgi:hypothetical protein